MFIDVRNLQERKAQRDSQFEGGRRLGEALRRRDFEHKAKKIAGKTAKCWIGIGLEY
jgi:hypothetical protein